VLIKSRELVVSFSASQRIMWRPKLAQLWWPNLYQPGSASHLGNVVLISCLVTPKKP